MANGNHKPSTTAELKDRLKELQTERSELGLLHDFFYKTKYKKKNI